MNQELSEIKTAIMNGGGTPYLVGGCVRDLILGQRPKDYDVEVFGMSSDSLIATLKRFGVVKSVGVSFGVIKLTTHAGGDYDFSLPRRDNKTGVGNKGFMPTFDPSMTIEDAALRRDYTINAMSIDPGGKVIDPYGGRADLEAGILRHISPAFTESEIRVLRGMQFAGRMKLTAAEETTSLCRNMIPMYKDLAKSHVWGEWYKWATKSVKPSYGLEFLWRTGWIKLYPELNALVGLAQEPDYHPEGSVWQHTKWVCDAAADIAIREGMGEEQRATLVFAALCHDMGKATTTQIIKGRITSHGHDEEGVALAMRFGQSINMPLAMTEEVKKLTRHHMAHVYGEPNARMARRLLVKLGNTTPMMLGHVMEADHSGRPPLPKIMPEPARKLIDLMLAQKDAIKPILTGFHLIERGWKPGREMGEALRKVYDAQIEGEITTLDQALAMVRNPTLKLLGL
jgi:tRNA nucleotidyltransferase (CCA-adding enzyme)